MTQSLGQIIMELERIERTKMDGIVERAEVVTKLRVCGHNLFEYAERVNRGEVK